MLIVFLMNIEDNIKYYCVMKEKERRDKLFNYLIELGFTKMKSDKFIYFKLNNEIFVFPKTLQSRHYVAVRKQLDMNGWISESDFNDKFHL